MLLEKAYRDELSGLLNRNGLKEAVKQLPEEKRHAVIAFDINCLKEINDSTGHKAVNEMIASVAEIIQANTREGDILARMDGDEFAIVLNGMDDGKFALEKMQKICNVIEQSKIPTTAIHPVCSAGIAILQNPSLFDETYQQAQRALYHVKSSGKGGCALWNESI